MLDRRVIDDQVDDDAHPAVARGPHDLGHIPGAAELRVDAVVVADVVAIIPPGDG